MLERATEPEYRFIAWHLSTMVVRMSNLLQKAFVLSKSLPEKEQDALAALIIDELLSDRRWREAFDKSGDDLDRLAAEALAEYHAEKTLPLDAARM